MPGQGNGAHAHITHVCASVTGQKKIKPVSWINF